MSSRRKQSKPRFLKVGEEIDGSSANTVNQDKAIEECTDENNLADMDPKDGEEDLDFCNDENDTDMNSNSAGHNAEVISPLHHHVKDSNQEKADGDEDDVEDKNQHTDTLTSGETENEAEFVHPHHLGVNEEFPYGCIFCNKAFAKFSHVREHELVHSLELPYQCEYCQRPFRHKRSRDRHMKLHTGDKNYKCSVCDSAFSRSDHLKNHMKSHISRKLPSLAPKSQDDDKTLSESGASQIKRPPIQCRLCKQTFTNYYQLDEHLKGHAHSLQSSPSNSSGVSTGKPPEYHCTHCAKQSLKQVFASLHALEQHVAHMHSGKGLSLLSCTHCDAAFPTVPTLNDHIEAKHRKGNTENLTPSAEKSMSSSSMNTVAKLLLTASGSSPDTSSATVAVTPSIMSNMEPSGCCCHLCSKAFTSVSQLVTHIQLTHVFGQRQLSQSTAAQSHEGDQREVNTPLDLSATNASPANMFVCQICGDTFSSILQLLEHNQLKHLLNVDKVRAKCYICMEVFSSPQQHLEHMEKHYLSMRREYLCTCCKSSFSMVDDLQTHLIMEHSRRVYQCLLCNDLFKSDVDLKLHLTVEHSNENKIYRCACCGKDFKDVMTWRAHIQQSHLDQNLLAPLEPLTTASNKDVLKCKYCSKTFSTENELYIHTLTHQKPLQCALCPERFAVEYLRDKHMQSVHSNPMRESSQDELSKHSPQLTIQSNGSTRQPYHCNICDRIFHSEDVYEEHKRKSHCVAKSWQSKESGHDASTSASGSKIQTKMFTTACTTCGKAFKTYSELDKHSRVHYGPVSLTCVICDEQFSSLSDMSKHRLQHCKVPAICPCILCPKEINTAQEFLDHSSQHIEADSSVICCACKHQITSQLELELHAEFHFPKKPTLRCASCKKPCPFSIQMPTQNQQFLLCQECLLSRKCPTSLLLTNGVRSPLPKTPEVKSPKTPKSSTSISTPSPTSELYRSNLFPMRLSPPASLHKCSICNVKFESVDELESHGCMMRKCSKCLEMFKMSALVSKLDSTFVCIPCDSVPADLWKCSKCKTTFTREEKYQKHHCIALGDGKPCQMCQELFNHSQLLLKGNQLVCKACNEKIVTCGVCKETHTNLETHLCQLRCVGCKEIFSRACKTSPQQPLCNICNEKQTTSQSPAEIHSNGKSSPGKFSTQLDKIYQCRQCQKTYVTEADIKVHVLTEHRNETNKCYLCQREFTTPAKLQIHLIEHNYGYNSNLTCPACPLELPSPSELLTHCLSSHPASSRSHQCRICGHGYFFEAELYNHTYSQHLTSLQAASIDRKRSSSSNNSLDEDNVITKKIKAEAVSDPECDDLFCTQCDMEFASLDHYNSHMTKNHSDSMVECDCGRVYSNDDDLLEHKITCNKVRDGMGEANQLLRRASASVTTV